MKPARRILLSFLLVPCLLGAIGCGIEAFDGQENSSDEALNITAIDKKALYALNSKVACADPSSEKDCPKEVGMIVDPVDEGVGQCTTAMVSDDIAITNAHCVPPSVRRDGAGCEGVMWISFPAAHGIPAKVYRCAEVIHVSFGAEKQSEYTNYETNDYAFIRLKHKPGRGFLKISFDSLAVGSSVSVFRVNPNSDYEGVKGDLNRLECTVDALHPTTAELKGCPIIHGNSGSPILVSGTVRGVAYGLDTKFLDRAAMTLIAPFEKKIRGFLTSVP